MLVSSTLGQNLYSKVGKVMIKTIAYVGMCVIGIVGSAMGVFLLVALAVFAMMGLIMWNQHHKISALSPPLASKLK